MPASRRAWPKASQPGSKGVAEPGLEPRPVWTPSQYPSSDRLAAEAHGHTWALPGVFLFSVCSVSRAVRIFSSGTLCEGAFVLSIYKRRLVSKLAG